MNALVLIVRVALLFAFRDSARAPHIVLPVLPVLPVLAGNPVP